MGFGFTEFVTTYVCFLAMVIQTIEVQPLEVFTSLMCAYHLIVSTKHMLIVHLDIPFLLQKTSCTLQVAPLFLELHDLHNEHC
jgi:hypothetical protein